MTQKLEKVAGWLLIIVAAATLYLTVWEFGWKNQGLSFIFMLIYIASAVIGITLLLDSKHALPKEFYEEA